MEKRDARRCTTPAVTLSTSAALRPVVSRMCGCVVPLGERAVMHATVKPLSHMQASKGTYCPIAW